MEIQFLGTGAGAPSKGRNVTSIVLKLLNELNEIWMFDCGEGTQQQILQTTIKPRKITKIFITHMHGDHLFGLPGLLSSRSFQGGDMSHLDIYGPKGIKDYCEQSLKLSDSHLSYPINYHEIEQPGVLFEDDKFKVITDFLDHRITCLGFRIEEKDRPGSLLIEKVKEANIPQGPLYAKLKKGEIITLEDGRTFDGKDFIDSAKKGRIVTILGDTKQTPVISKLAKNADVLVHESTFGEHEHKLAKRYYHSTSAQAATIALNNQVKQLYLTHISARYIGNLAYQLQKEAQEIFPASRVVWDFDHFSIPLESE